MLLLMPMKVSDIQHRVDLSALSTFRLPAQAAELVTITRREQLPDLPSPESDQLILGAGSNTVFLADWPGRILLNRLSGIRFESAGEQVLVHAAAGENWHRLVLHCLKNGVHGLENLVLIPGSVGAAPIQNIGAYGVELADVFHSLTAWDQQARQLVEFDREACHFGYRDSYFKSGESHRYFITEVRLRLSHQFQPNTTYASLSEALAQAGITHPTARQLAATVMRLRRHRLPDPARLANAGSFFKNPIVDKTQADAMLQSHPDLPHWPMANGQIKLGAGRMIELLGWKGKNLGGAGVYANHALVLVNHGGASGNDVRQLVDAVTQAVAAEFGIDLEPEPLLLPYSSSVLTPNPSAVRLA